MWNEAETNQLESGEMPVVSEFPRNIGIDFITDFWQKQYLDEYIEPGGSKIKFITGGQGGGKSASLRIFLHEASQRGFKAVYLSAKTTWIHDFKEVFAAIFMQSDIMNCYKKCADIIIGEMGYNSSDIPQGMSLSDFLARSGEFDPVTKREIRSQLNKLFYKNPRIDKNFAVSSALLTGRILGYPVLEPSSEKLLFDWLSCVKGLRASELRKLELSGAKITKQNARHMLRSLIEVLKMAGYKGLVVGIDSLEVLISSNSLEEIRYTKLRREDAYESIRELIDDIDTLGNTMIVFTQDRELLENENAGFKSYQALWMRIQNEIESVNFNRFADIIDLDRLKKQSSPEAQLKMSRRFAEEPGEAARGDYPSRRIIEALRSGISSREVGLYFSSARPKIMRELDDRLEQMSEDNCSGGTIITGKYGEGKTHLLNSVF